jgi:predicted porin
MKKILPVMIGAALAGGMTAAAADVTVFGHIDTSIVNFDDGGSGPNSDDTRFVCTTCSIGFKGSEDLGNGLKAIFKLDFQYDTTVRNDGDGTGGDGDNDNSGLLDRDQWLGLAGGFGKVRIGTISTGYKSHGAAIDPLYRTVAQGRDVGLQSSFHRGAGEELQGRATNTVRWDSPDFNGVKLVAHYTLDSDESTEDDDPFGIGASYENGGILVFADYMDANGSVSTGNDVSVWKVGGKYSMNNFAVYGQYESEDYGTGDFTVWHVAGSYNIDNNMIYVGFGQDEDEPNGGTDIEGESFTIAAVHSMSKRTSAYAAYVSHEEDFAPDEDAFAIGLKHKF